MHLFNNKKAELLTILIVITFILFATIGFGTWLINLGSRECKTNSQCGSDSYCGSDFACHQIPVIEKTIVQNNFVVPSIIIGIAIVIAAIILKSNKIHFNKKAEETKQENVNKNPLRMP